LFFWFEKINNHMANKTFGDLPLRSGITENDFFVTNREKETISPEGRISLSVLRNSLYQGLIVKNDIYDISSKVDVKTSNNTIDIKNDDKSLITFKNFSKNVYGVFQISCKRTGSTNIGTSVACIFDLLWVPSLKNTKPITIFENQNLIISNNPNSVMNNSCLFIPSFIPVSSGNFQLRVRFTQTLASAKCQIDSSFWIIQTQ
jgi:hypothetical protein